MVVSVSSIEREVGSTMTAAVSSSVTVKVTVAMVPTVTWAGIVLRLAVRASSSSSMRSSIDVKVMVSWIGSPDASAGKLISYGSRVYSLSSVPVLWVRVNGRMISR